MICLWQCFVNNVFVDGDSDLFCAAVCHKSPWNTPTIVFCLIQEMLTLTLFSVVNTAFFLFVRKLLKAFGPSHFFEGAHSICCWSKCCVMCKGVDMDFKGRLLLGVCPNVSVIWTCLEGSWIQQQEQSIDFAFFSWSGIYLCNIKGVAKLALQDSWLKLFTESLIRLRYSSFTKETVVHLVGTEGDKCRGWELAFVYGQMNRMKGKPLRNTIFCWNKDDM